MLKSILKLFVKYKREESTISLFLGVPFIFKINLVKYWSWQGRISVRFLIFNLDIGLFYGLGWSVSQNWRKWVWELRIHLKRVMILFTVGFEAFDLVLWQIRWFKFRYPKKFAVNKANFERKFQKP